MFNARSDWGAQAPRGALSGWSPAPIGIAIHYVGGGGSIGLLERGHAACLQTMRNLQAYAFSGGNGWTYSDLEYNLMACPHGYVIEGRGLEHQGAAQKGANATHVSICALANVGDTVTSGLASALIDAIATVQARFPSARSVVGHRDTAGNPTGTNCAGNFIEGWIFGGRPGSGGAPGPAPAPRPAPAPSGPPVLRQGSTGQAVVLLQTLLHIPADGQFGPQTKAAVVAFQHAHGLTADGIVGVNTWGALTKTAGPPPAPPKPAPAPAPAAARPTLRRGSKGQAVKELQLRLISKGFKGLVVDGDFGPATEGAVRKFQDNIRLFFHLPHFEVDGIVGGATWYWLSV